LRITATKSTPVAVPLSVLRITGKYNAGLSTFRCYLLEEPKRLKVVKALERALKVAESEGVFVG
jgi:hypothetical protein